MSRQYLPTTATPWITSGLLLTLLLNPAFAQERTTRAQAQPGTSTSEPATAPIPKETSSVTRHQLDLGGKTLKYTATAGTLHIPGADETPYGSIFFVAYTLDDAEPARRPVTFLYNGGPGSASIWLHMGSVGPVRVITASPEATGAGPYDVVPNEYSLLDHTDLVFIDAPLSGYSRAVGKGAAKDFAGVDQDVTAFNKFIKRWISVNHRWNSPHFLFGESYGTTRSAALVNSLENDGVSVNGVILLSSVLNYFNRSPGILNQYIGNLPTYAATAWYFKKVPHKGTEKDFIEAARVFARGEYAEALAQGHNLPPARFEAVAAKLAGFTGLSAAYIKDSNLRIAPTRFRKEFARGERLILGRYDTRFEGSDVDAAGENPGYDPSSTGITGAYVTSFRNYLDQQLKYTSDLDYRPSGSPFLGTWDRTHRAPGAGGGPVGPNAAMRDAYVAGDLADAMRKNPYLKVLSANGLFDLATPFFQTELDLAQMDLEKKLVPNVEFSYYPAGHMIYLNVDALKQFKSDLASWYQRTLSRGK
ncbi:S10 family peptidase [Paludibaculum fermentans]|uniref:Peptidase S10 n=1 Tax=Paludibaculum fermentans TaxID=1473598 RepID=A0A7S7NSE8_PALFE|nr:peptidase S10 [Paludibaculum fermentans]QOY88968.1 peptidase S10 [Paludibaculum fermentans]